MIKILNVNKNFKKLQVLRNVSADFPAGTVTAVVGPNGSGKTTLMKCILGLVSPTTGSIVVDGVSAIRNELSRTNLGYMAQIAQYPENLTAREIINMVKGLRHASNCNWEELSEYFNLTPHINKQMRTLSGGTRQKVGATIAMMYQPKFLLLDEPTAGLDPLSADRLKNKISNYRDNGATVLVTSHILSEIQELADRVLYLQEGSVFYQGSVSTLLSETKTENLSKAIAHVMLTAGASI